MNDIQMMKCNIASNLEEVLKCIDANGKKVAFLVDDDDVMVGLLTDGDVRRILLSGNGLKEKAALFVKNDFRFATSGDSPEKIAKMFDYRISIIPILDKAGRVVDFAEYDEKLHVSVAQPELNGNEYKYLMDAFLSTWISSKGKYIDLFERKFAEFCGDEYGVATSNGTTALHLALASLGIGKGDEVIIPDLTFAATINAVLYTGATPVIVDIEKDSWCIDPKKIEEAITERTKAVIPVHLYGQPCDMKSICELAQKYKIFIIEDCAEAHGAEWCKKKVGSFGIIGCFSFFGNKVITTGEGGMCITNDEEIYKQMRILRDHGMSQKRRYYHEVVGFNYRMTNMQAAIGCAQLERIDEILKNRCILEQEYRKRISNNGVKFQRNDFPNRKKITWLVSVLIEEEKRELLFEKMQEKGIDTRSFFIPLSEMGIYADFAKECIVSKMISRRGINLPTSYEINEKIIDTIARIIDEVI